MPPRIAVYRGAFGRDEAERLLWRAGFGPRPGEADRLARKGLHEAVRTLTSPGRERLTGPKPHERNGRPLAPRDAWGHDHLWWLDRMVRTRRPLVERMTLIWHDWFATSNDGVDSQRLMLKQNELFRRNSLGSFRSLLLQVTHDHAMLVWLNGIENEKGSPNENYARELMELFTLGAGRGYTEADVREQARALTGWARDWKYNKPFFHYDRKRHDTGTKRVFGRGGNFDWTDACLMCLRHPRHASFFVRKLWSYFIPTQPNAATQRALEALYRRGYQIRPVVTAILKHPDLYTGPRMVKPPVVHNAGLLRAIGRGIDTTDWTWIAPLAGQRLFYPPNVAGWDESRWLDTSTFRGRWLLANYTLQTKALEVSSNFNGSTDPERVLARAHEFWGKPQLTGTHAKDPARVREGLAANRGHGHETPRLHRRADRERAAAADRRLPRPHDLLMARCCNDFTRTELVRRGVATAGAGLPGIEAGMPLPAGTGLTRRSLLTRSLGVGLAVYGATRSPLSLFEDAIANAAPSADRVLVSVFLDGGADSLSILFPAGDPKYRALRPVLGLAPDAGSAFADDSRLRWHPAAASLASLHAERKLTVFPAIGYTGPDQSHFTSRHYWEVGATDADLRTGWLGRVLDRIGDGDNPLQGLSLDYHLHPTLATGRVPIASLDSPDGYSFWAKNVWGDVQDRMLETVGAMGSAHAASKDPALKRAGEITVQSMRLRQQLLPFGGKTITSPVAYPTSNDAFPKRLRALGAMLGAGLPIRCVALRAPGHYDTHSDQPDALARGLKLTADSLLAFQRDLEARGLADRVLVHVWSEFGRRAKENGSRGTDHGAAGIGFVLGTRTTGAMVGEFPGLADGTGIDRHGNLQATSDFRAVYAALIEQWLATDAGAIIPRAGSFQRPQLVR